MSGRCGTCGKIYSSVGPKGDPGADGASGALKPVIVADAATLTLNGPTDSGSLILLDRAAGTIVTLPDTPANGTNYTFQVKTDVTSNNYQINTGVAGLDLLSGYVYNDKAGSLPAIVSPDPAHDTSITMNGSTTGGLVGTNFTLTFDGTNLWNISGTVRGSGTMTTPFS